MSRIGLVLLLVITLTGLMAAERATGTAPKRQRPVPPRRRPTHENRSGWSPGQLVEHPLLSCAGERAGRRAIPRVGWIARSETDGGPKVRREPECVVCSCYWG